jgi:hypothetical protein
VIDNLAVLCFDCHRDTQIRGGFDRKLDAAQVRLYKADWIKRIEEQRNTSLVSTRLEPAVETHVLRYMQIREESEEHLYDFEADYVLVGSNDSRADTETNLCINAFISTCLKEFRVSAIGSATGKIEMKKAVPKNSLGQPRHLPSPVAVYTRGSFP